MRAGYGRKDGVSEEPCNVNQHTMEKGKYGDGMVVGWEWDGKG